MASLPIPAKDFFRDFDFDLLDYKVLRASQRVAELKGMLNKDDDGQHIAFLLGFDILPGDILAHGPKTYTIKSVDFDTYNGNPEMIKAYY